MLIDRLFENKAFINGLKKRVDYPTDTFNNGLLNDRSKSLTPKDKIKHKLRKELGSGAFGTVYKTDKGVSKLDGGAEKHLAKYIKNHKRLSKLSILPKIHKVSTIKLGKDTAGKIDREDLADINNSEDSEFVNKIYNSMHPTEIVDEKGKWINKDNVPITKRLILRNLIDAYHKHKPNNDRKYKKVVTGLARLIHHGIKPNDISRNNWGQKKNGDLAIRDMGLWGVYHDEPKSENRSKLIRTNLNKNINKLKMLKNNPQY